MKRVVVGRHLLPEMLALGAIELVLTFALALILLTPSSGSFSFASVHPAILCAMTVCFTAFVTGLYRPQMFQKARALVFTTTLGALLSFPAVWIVSKTVGLNTYWPVGYDPFRPLKIVAIWSAGVLCIRLLFLLATRCNLFVHRVAVVGPAESQNVVAATRAGRKGFLEISVVRPEHACAASLSAARIRTLVFSAANQRQLVPAIRQEYNSRGILVQSESEFWERQLKRVDVGSGNKERLILSSEKQRSSIADTSTRVLDVATSLCLVIATLPIMFVVAVFVRLDSRGPVFYRQERVGLHNKPFILFKFRSMNTDAEISGPRWAQTKDPRVTRIGAFMRKTRIDELPQLLNILRGEMSFIGPRPERPHFVEQLTKVIPWYEERSRVKPGLTGWAQVNYPYGASVEDARAKLSYDLYYVKNRSFFLDILILLSTIRVILLQEGAR